MMVGLQGSGKTTTAAKLARYLDKSEGKKPMLVAADMQRPAAVEQLQVLGQQIGVPVFNVPGASPLDICKAAPAEAKEKGCDVIVYDTAGRLAIDEALMTELGDIKSAVAPENIYLVVDAMIGQDAVKVSRGFHDRLDITGVILTNCSSAPTRCVSPPCLMRVCTVWPSAFCSTRAKKRFTTPSSTSASSNEMRTSRRA